LQQPCQLSSTLVWFGDGLFAPQSKYCRLGYWKRDRTLNCQQGVCRVHVNQDVQFTAQLDTLWRSGGVDCRHHACPLHSTRPAGVQVCLPGWHALQVGCLTQTWQLTVYAITSVVIVAIVGRRLCLWNVSVSVPVSVAQYLRQGMSGRWAVLASRLAPVDDSGCLFVCMCGQWEPAHA
jgi:hypothetical protein